MCARYKPCEVTLSMAIAAQHQLNVLKSYTQQSFLDGVLWRHEGMRRSVSTRPTGCWNEFRTGTLLYYALQLMSMNGTRQTARQWHVRTLTCIEGYCYAAVKSEKTIFMKRKR